MRHCSRSKAGIMLLPLRLQVLADGEDLHAGVAQGVHDVAYFLAALAEAEHEA